MGLMSKYIYRSKLRGTMWRMVSSRTKPCGKVYYKLRSEEGEVVIFVSDDLFKKNFEVIK